MPAYDAPSTVAPNPLAEGMARILGQDPLSTSTGTSDLLSYQDNAGARLPASDVIAITGDPGTGATTAETWAHELALQNQAQQLTQFAWQKQQADISNAMQQAAAQREADMFGYQKSALELQNRLAQQKYALDQAAENREAHKWANAIGDEQRARQGLAAQADYNQFRGGITVPVSYATQQAYNQYLAAGSPTTGAYSTYNANDPSWKYYNVTTTPGMNVSGAGGTSGFGGHGW